MQCPQHDCFTCVPNQPLPALLRYPWGKQGWGRVRLFPSSICPTQASGKGLQPQPRLAATHPTLPSPASSKGASWGRKTPEFPHPVAAAQAHLSGPSPQE